jgi:hypothetical protein
MLINGRTMVMVQGEVLMPVVVSFLVRVVRIVQRQESGEVKVFSRCLVL